MKYGVQYLKGEMVYLAVFSEKYLAKVFLQDAKSCMPENSFNILGGRCKMIGNFLYGDTVIKTAVLNKPLLWVAGINKTVYPDKIRVLNANTDVFEVATDLRTLLG